MILPTPVEARPDGAQVQRAVILARQHYPGPIGDFLARELDVWRNFGYRFETGGRLGRLVTALLALEAS